MEQIVLDFAEGIEAFAIDAHNGAHCDKGVLVDAAGDFQDHRCVALAADNHNNLAVILCVPTLAVHNRSAAASLDIDGVGDKFVVGADDKYLA